MVMLNEPDIRGSLLCTGEESLSFVLVVVILADKLLTKKTGI